MGPRSAALKPKMTGPVIFLQQTTTQAHTIAIFMAKCRENLLELGKPERQKGETEAHASMTLSDDWVTLNGLKYRSYPLTGQMP